MADLQSIKKVLDSGTGLALKEFLLGRLSELRDIDNINEKDVATHQAIELKAQKRAFEKLRGILSEIMTFSEEEMEKDPRDSYLVD